MRKTIHSEHGRIISQALQNMRQKAGLTQRALADKLDRERSFVANYELGDRRVDLAEFYWICRACGASPHNEAFNIMKAFLKLE